jgi:hypothetical protein
LLISHIGKGFSRYADDSKLVVLARVQGAFAGLVFVFGDKTTGVVARTEGIGLEFGFRLGLLDSYANLPLQETLNYWKQLPHILKYFRAEEDPNAKRPQNFMSGFLEVRFC